MKQHFLHIHYLKQIFLHALLTVIVLASTSCVSQQYYYNRAVSEVFQTELNGAVIFATVDSLCGKTGALRFAQQMAAITTLRQGYERFIVVKYNAESETKLESKPDFWGTTYTTTTVETGHKAEVEILMLNQDDEGFVSGLDAIRVLGPTWREKVTYGIETCE